MSKEKAIQYYQKQVKVYVLRATNAPLELLNDILDTSIKGKSSTERIQTAILMGHTSFLEFIDIIFKISPVTKSFLGQLTRHRMASYMSSSYHYTIAKNNDWILPYIEEEELQNLVYDVHVHNFDLYTRLIEADVLKEEARQILPGSIAHTIKMKFNGRSLVNFLNLRLCHRNIPEMIAISNEIQRYCMQWCPEVFCMALPDCQLNGCRQGKMMCKRKEFNGNT